MANDAKPDSDKVKGLMKALSHDLRIRILRAFIPKSESIAPVVIAAEIGEPLTGVAYHVRVLAKAELLTLTRAEPVGGSTKHFYALNRAVSDLPMVKAILDAADD